MLSRGSEQGCTAAVLAELGTAVSALWGACWGMYTADAFYVTDVATSTGIHLGLEVDACSDPLQSCQSQA